MAPLEFVLVALDEGIKSNKNEKIEIAVAISHFDKVFLLQYSRFFARWNRRLAYDLIPSKLAEKMPAAFDRYRHFLLFMFVSLALPIRSNLCACVQAYAQLVIPSLTCFTLHRCVFAVVATTIGHGK